MQVNEPTNTTLLQDTVIELENYMVETNKGLNTFRVKRESTFELFKAKVSQYLNGLVDQLVLASVMINLTQSGKKKMGMYIVGTITLLSHGETVDVPVKLKMNSWKESKSVIDANKPIAQPEPSAA